MREIKFRAWDTKSESMEYEIAIGKGYGEDSYILFLGLGETFIIDDDIVKIMQYTGLKDKNNVEIFEYMEIDNTYEVSFLNGSYVLTNISNGDIMLLSNYMENHNGKVEITREYTKV